MRVREFPRQGAIGGVALLAAIVWMGGCAPGHKTMTTEDVKRLARGYTAAWNSQDPAQVASFYAEDGSLQINDGEPSVGREAIAAAAEGFMTAFPDLAVKMDGLRVEGNRAIYFWTLTGTNTGPGGTGAAVEISGSEDWTLGPDGLIAASEGNFDEAEYERQLAEGPPPTP